MISILHPSRCLITNISIHCVMANSTLFDEKRSEQAKLRVGGGDAPPFFRLGPNAPFRVLYEGSEKAF
jgi:hypothetical protein